MHVIPLDDRILVRPLHAVGDHGRMHMRGTVIAVGTGAHVGAPGAAPPVQAGDTILFGSHLGCEVRFGDTQYWIIKADDILKIEVRAVAVALKGGKGRHI
jgi:co-chaperonin GroES (HSP10)